ncbi:penicillin-insensitive murein endopeptidase [Candidatus Woesearchaeota archaeon]|nr:penicillin-insensitive murein endopeptidase [Candidatus Woesearchaeota archaeon]
MNKKTILRISLYTLLSLHNHAALTPQPKKSLNYKIPTHSFSIYSPPFLTLKEISFPPNYLFNKSPSLNTPPSSREISPLEKCLMHPHSYLKYQPNKFTPLPTSSHLEITRPPHSYGRPELTDALDFAGCVIFETYHVPLMTKDLSRKQGGKFLPHKSHRLGLDADVGIYTYHHHGYANTNYSLVSGSRIHPEFSNKQALEANWTFVKNLIDGPSEIQVIMVDHYLINTLRNYVLKHHGQEEWNKYNRFRHEPGHKDHYHIRVRLAKKLTLT